MRIPGLENCHVRVLEEILHSLHVPASAANAMHSFTNGFYSNSAIESRDFSEAHLCNKLLLSDSAEDQRTKLGWGAQRERGVEGGQGCKERTLVREACFDSPRSAMGGAGSLRWVKRYELQRVVLGEKGSPGRESGAGWGKTDEGLGLKVKPRQAEFSN